MKTKKVTWIKSHPGFAYFVGDSCDMAAKQAGVLLKGGYVKEYVEPEPDGPVIDLPEDLPGRDALISNNITTMAEVKAIKDFTEIKGIGKSTDEQIHEFLNA